MRHIFRPDKVRKPCRDLEEAAKLDRPEANLLVASVDDAADMKDKAALEYAEFLKKKPDYSGRKELEDYIAANKKD